MMLDADLIDAINELQRTTGKRAVFRSMPGLPDFEFDAEASGFSLPTDRTEIEQLAASYRAWVEAQRNQQDTQATQQ